VVSELGGTPSSCPLLHPNRYRRSIETYEQISSAFPPESITGVQEEVQLREQDFGGWALAAARPCSLEAACTSSLLECDCFILESKGSSMRRPSWQGVQLREQGGGEASILAHRLPQQARLAAHRKGGPCIHTYAGTM